MGIFDKIFSSKPKRDQQKHTQHADKKDEISVDKMNKINIRKILDKIEKAKKIVIIEDSEIRELFAYVISKKYPGKKIYTAGTFEEANKLLKDGEEIIDKDTVVYLDNMIPRDKESENTIAFGLRAYSIIKENAGFLFVCSNDVESFPKDTIYITKGEMVGYLRGEREKEKATITKEEFQYKIRNSEKVIIVDDNDIFQEMLKRDIEDIYKKEVFTINNAKELEEAINRGDINKDTLVLLDNTFPYIYVKAEWGREFYWRLKRIGCEVVMISGENKSKFSGMKHIDKMELSSYLY